MFVYHRLGKLDTLAGLAIRYGVTVSDLKRANGLHSEMGMFALRELKVPKGQLPASHAGFQALLSQRRTPPEISTEASSALDKLRSHYGTGRLLPEAGGEAVAGGGDCHSVRAGEGSGVVPRRRQSLRFRQKAGCLGGGQLVQPSPSSATRGGGPGVGVVSGGGGGASRVEGRRRATPSANLSGGVRVAGHPGHLLQGSGTPRLVGGGRGTRLVWG